MSKWEEKRLEDIIDVNPPVKLKKGESYPFIDIDKVSPTRRSVTNEEVKVYDELLANMMQELPYAAAKKAPDLLVHLDISYDTMIHRIEKRGRSYEQPEQDPTLPEYYHNLLSRYDGWYDDYDYSPKMKIDGDKYDFVENPEDSQKVLDLIDEQLRVRGTLD